MRALRYLVLLGLIGLALFYTLTRPDPLTDADVAGLTGDATRGATGSVYLNAEFTVLHGPYARRKIFSLIGLYSPKGPDWGNMGRALVRGILNSARGLSDKDKSPEAQNARRISGFADLDGVEFVARIDVGADTNGDEKNEIRTAVTRDHKDYAALMGGGPMAASGYAPTPVYAPAAPQTTAPAAAASATPAPATPSSVVRPTWAQ